MDREQALRVGMLIPVVGNALDGAIDKEASACDVMLAVIVQAVAISKQLEIDENEFFDTVVMMYGSVSVEHPERH